MILSPTWCGTFIVKNPRISCLPVFESQADLIAGILQYLHFKKYCKLNLSSCDSFKIKHLSVLCIIILLYVYKGYYSICCLTYLNFFVLSFFAD